MSYLSREISEIVFWMNMTLEIWEDLHERYHQKGVFRISDIQEEIYSLGQGETTITQYFTTLKKLWQEYDNFRPRPQCTCSTPYNCQLLPTIKAYREGDYVIRFLKGFNETYSPIRSKIMLMHPLPFINKVFLLLIQQERQQ